MDLCIYSENAFEERPDLFIAQLDKINDLEAYQEQLGVKLDQVEAEIMEEIEKHSATFTSTFVTIQEIRDALSNLDSASSQILKDYSVISQAVKTETSALQDLYKDHEGLLQVQAAVEKLAEILKTQKKINELLNLCSFEEAVFLIEKAERDIDTGFPDFAPIDPLRRDLAEMKIALAKMKAAPIADGM